MHAAELSFRPGGPADRDAILELWDAAVEWMVARDQPEQWGTEPVSNRPSAVAQLTEWLAALPVTIAELNGEPVGVSVLSDTPPDHVARIDQPETYLMFLLGSRGHSGRGIGAKLVERAAADARARESAILRVDCWGGAPTLVAWYERQGFVRSDSFDLNGWIGQVFEMAL